MKNSIKLYIFYQNKSYFRKMWDEVIDVTFSYEEYDHVYNDSLLNDFSKYESNGDGKLNKKEFVLWSIDSLTNQKVAKYFFCCCCWHE